MTSSHTNQVRQCSSSSSLSDKNHGRSKSQMCLKKILDFISLHSSNKTHQINIQSGEDKAASSRGELGGCGLCSKVFEFANKGGFSASSGVVGADIDGSSEVSGDYASTVDKSSGGGKEIQVVIIADGTREESSEITEFQVRSSEIENNQTEAEDAQARPYEIKAGKRKKQVEVVEEQSKFYGRKKGNGFLDLLVEAAKVVSADFGEDDADAGIKEEENAPSQTVRSAKSVPPDLERSGKWMLLNCYKDYEVDISPIVRSKRGRNQVLPCRYRDSVLDPYNINTTKQRSSRISCRRSSRK